MSQDKLKNCPFCNGEATLDDESNAAGSGSGVTCKKCHSRSPWFDNYYIGMEEAENKAIKAWNTRPNQGLVPLSYETLWVEFEKFLDPYTCDLIIKPDYARNAHHFQYWVKSVCERFGTPNQGLMPLDEALKELDAEIRSEENCIEIEKLAGNVVKEERYRGIAIGLKIGRQICAKAATPAARRVTVEEINQVLIKIPESDRKSMTISQALARHINGGEE